MGVSLGAFLIGLISNAQMRGWIEIELGLSVLVIFGVGLSKLRALERELEENR